MDCIFTFLTNTVTESGFAYRLDRSCFCFSGHLFVSLICIFFFWLTLIGLSFSYWLVKKVDTTNPSPSFILSVEIVLGDVPCRFLLWHLLMDRRFCCFGIVESIDVFLFCFVFFGGEGWSCLRNTFLLDLTGSSLSFLFWKVRCAFYSFSVWKTPHQAVAPTPASCHARSVLSRFRSCRSVSRLRVDLGFSASVFELLLFPYTFWLLLLY